VHQKQPPPSTKDSVFVWAAWVMGRAKAPSAINKTMDFMVKKACAHRRAGAAAAEAAAVATIPTFAHFANPG
jgi:hypothetical protein